MFGQGRHHLLRIASFRKCRLNSQQHSRPVTVHDMLHHVDNPFLADKPDHGFYMGHGDHIIRHARTLVENTQCIAKSSVRMHRDKPCRFGIKLYAAAFGYMQQMLRNILRRNTTEGIALAPGQNRNRNLLRFRRRKNKHNMCRRLFNRLEQCIPCFVCQHVCFVDNKNFLTPFYGHKLCTFTERSHFINPAI